LTSLVKPTVVANTRVWSFIVEKLQSKIVVIHGLCTQSLALYEATGQAKWLRKPLPGIDNGKQQQYTPFECFHSYDNMLSVLPNTLTMAYMLQRRKSRII